MVFNSIVGEIILVHPKCEIIVNFPTIAVAILDYSILKRIYIPALCLFS